MGADIRCCLDICLLHSLTKSYLYVVSHISCIDAHEMSLEYLRLNFVYSVGGIVDRRDSGLNMVGVLESGSSGQCWSLGRGHLVVVLNKTLKFHNSPLRPNL